MMFMHRYSETVEEYQIRRICSLIAELKTTHRMLKSHELLREAGLSLERAKPLTLSILSDL